MATNNRFDWLGQKPRTPRPIPERVLWTEALSCHIVEARTRDVEIGPELRVFLNNELLWSNVIRDGTLERLSEEERQHWIEKGRTGDH